jgi:hypothetical protein
MTHSHDRTLLAALGFADPDKREPLHDLACEYLAEESQRERLMRLAGVSEKATSRSVLEAAIAKGEGQYRTTIGFLDLRIDWIDETVSSYSARAKGSVLTEVKIRPVGVGDILRQINLYRSHITENLSYENNDIRSRIRAMDGEKAAYKLISDKFWVLATTFELDHGQAQTIRGANITHIRLGDGFTKWFEGRQHRPAPTPEQF